MDAVWRVLEVAWDLFRILATLALVGVWLWILSPGFIALVVIVALLSLGGDRAGAPGSGDPYRYVRDPGMSWDGDGGGC